MLAAPPKIIVFNVTNRCNLNCPFCFGPECDDEPSLEEAHKIIDKISADGAGKIVFTGGEPLLRADVFELIKYARGRGLYTILHTNGMLFSENVLSKLRSQLDQINLPLDGGDAYSNDKQRGEGHFAKVLSALKLLRGEKIKVVVSSVVTAENLELLPAVGGRLQEWVESKSAKIDIWRVFQFQPKSKAASVKDRFAILHENFSASQKKITGQKYSFAVEFIPSGDSEFHKSYKVI